MLSRWDRSKPSWEGRVSGSPGLGVSSPGIDGDGGVAGPPREQIAWVAEHRPDDPTLQTARPVDPPASGAGSAGRGREPSERTDGRGDRELAAARTERRQR